MRSNLGLPDQYYALADTVCSCGKSGEEAIQSHIHETIVVDSETGGQKGAKESELHCMPYEAAWELGRVFKMGGLKHGDYNFRKGLRWSLLYDAAQRHGQSFWNGEDWNIEEFTAKDGTSQRWRVHHAIQAAWHYLILAFYSLTGRGTDDRPK